MTESITIVTAGMNTIIHTVSAMINFTIRNTNIKNRRDTTRSTIDITMMMTMMMMMTIDLALKSKH